MNDNTSKVIASLFALVLAVGFVFLAPIIAIKIYSLTFAAFFGLPIPGYWMMLALLTAKNYLFGNTGIMLRLDDLKEKEEDDKILLAYKRVLRNYIALFVAWGVVWLCVG